MSRGRVYLSTPLPHQVEVLRHPARSKVVVCGRRWGKTRGGQLACVEGHGPCRVTGYESHLVTGQSEPAVAAVP